MKDKPYEKRKRGIAAITQRFPGKGIPGRCIRVSRFYPPDKSWTDSPAWWFDLPLERLESAECERVFLACEHEPGCDFHILSVPGSFVLENRGGLCVITVRKMVVVRLHLSARQEDWLVDLRGTGHVSFARFERK